MQEVVLVDQFDQPIGTMEKLEAHRQGLLHRAFSVFIFNVENKLLLQQRALEKYHSGGLWTNTCCSHPGPEEPLEKAGERRLQEEMGFSVPLTTLFAFEYRVNLDNGMTEHELDHVLIGRYNDVVSPNPAEVMDHQWISLPELQTELAAQPEKYTSWLKIILQEHADRFSNFG